MAMALTCNVCSCWFLEHNSLQLILYKLLNYKIFCLAIFRITHQYLRCDIRAQIWVYPCGVQSFSDSLTVWLFFLTICLRVNRRHLSDIGFSDLYQADTSWASRAWRHNPSNTSSASALNDGFLFKWKDMRNSQTLNTQEPFSSGSIRGLFITMIANRGNVAGTSVFLSDSTEYTPYPFFTLFTMVVLTTH